VRLAIWVLLAANVLVLAWGGLQHYLGGPVGGVHTPELAPERIKLMSADEVRERRAQEQTVACVEWGGFAPQDADRAEQFLGSAGFVLKPVQRRVEPGATWSVFIPPAASRAAAETRLAQLRERGISDATLVLDDPRRMYAISFGTFKSEQTAQRRHDELAGLGVGDAVAAPRDPITTRVFLRLTDVPRALIAQLTGIKDDFLGTDVTVCPHTP
jgi:hypothetical protein